VAAREWFGRPLLEGWSSSYRPITSMSFALEGRLVPGAALSHLTNWLTYLLLCGLLMRALLERVSAQAALGAGLLFALWPVHVEAVASLVGRAELFASSFGLLALLQLERDELGPRQWGVAGLLYALALLSKESVALLPAIVAWRVLLRWRKGTVTRGHWVGVACVSVVGLAYIIPRQLFLSVELPDEFVGADNPLLELSGADRLWGTISVLGHYADVGVRALRLCADHTWADVVPSTSPAGAGAGFLWLGLILLAGAVFDAVRAWRGQSEGWWAATGIAYLLVGHFIIPLSVILAERLCLWPSVLMAFALAHGLAANHSRLRGVARAGLALLMLWWGGRTVVRSLDWRDDLSLGRSSVGNCPRALHNRMNLAVSLARAGEHDEALWHFGVSAAARQGYPQWRELPAYQAEAELPLAERLPRLPELVEAPDPRGFWMGLANYLGAQGWGATAQRAAGFGQGGGR
jgi:hypothetical protein